MRKSIKWFCDDELIRRLETEADVLALLERGSFIRIEMGRCFLQLIDGGDPESWYLEIKGNEGLVGEVVDRSQNLLPILERYEEMCRDRGGVYFGKRGHIVSDKLLYIIAILFVIVQSSVFVLLNREGARFVESLCINGLGSSVLLFSVYSAQKDLFFGRFFDSSRNNSPISYWAGFLLSISFGVGLNSISYIW